MRIRKLIPAAALGATLITSAFAIPAQAAEKPAVTTAASAKAPASAAGYVYKDWYWTRANCNAAGTVLKNAGETIKFYCQNNGVVVDLYIWK